MGNEEETKATPPAPEEPTTKEKAPQDKPEKESTTETPIAKESGEEEKTEEAKKDDITVASEKTKNEEMEDVNNVGKQETEPIKTPGQRGRKRKGMKTKTMGLDKNELEQLVPPYFYKKICRSARPARSSRGNESDVRRGGVLSNHMLLENIGKRSANCYLCSIMTDDTIKRTSIYGCVQCKQAFHVNCFTLYHFRDAFHSHRPVLVGLICENDGSQGRKRRRRRRENTVTSTLKDARLPFPI